MYETVLLDGGAPAICEGKLLSFGYCSGWCQVTIIATCANKQSCCYCIIYSIFHVVLNGIDACDITEILLQSLPLDEHATPASVRWQYDQACQYVLSPRSMCKSRGHAAMLHLSLHVQ